MTNNEKPMTKAEVRSYLKRIRDAVRGAEQSLRGGYADELLSEIIEIGGCAGTIEGYLDSTYGEPIGIRGVS